MALSVINCIKAPARNLIMLIVHQNSYTIPLPFVNMSKNALRHQNKTGLN